MALTTLIPPSTVETWGISVTNGASPIGGADPETVESMRFSIPRSTGRLKSRAVTLNDYADLALQVPGVAKAIAYGTLYTAVYVRLAPVGGAANDNYMERLIASVESYLADKVLVGTRVFAEPGTLDDLWVNSYVRIAVHVQPAYNRTQVRKTVESTVRSIFSFDNVDFGSKITLGQVYRAVLAVQGVEWAEVKWLDHQAPSNSSVEVDMELNASVRSVTDIIPDDIHIVRINPTSVIEDSGIWPSLTLDERTHDGLVSASQHLPDGGFCTANGAGIWLSCKSNAT